jgi:poly(A) polymerase
LAALDAAGHANEALRLSRADAARTARLRDGALSQAGAAELGWRLGVSDAAAALCLRAALTAQPMPEGWHDKARHGAQAVFPVVAADLMPALTGPALGQALARLQAAWLASDMQLGRAALIARVPPAGERDER